MLRLELMAQSCIFMLKQRNEHIVIRPRFFIQEMLKVTVEISPIEHKII